MDFELSEEQREVWDFLALLDEKIVPQASAIDEAHSYPRALFDELGKLGLFAMRYPATVGGLELDLLRSAWHSRRLRVARCRLPAASPCSR